VPKSPAQVAAEKAAMYKKQQLEAEEAKKNKNYIRKLVPTKEKVEGDQKHIEFSRLEEELQ